VADPIDRFDQARWLGPLALLRLRAEVLLQHAAEGTIPLTEAEAERLHRIALMSIPEDAAFLATFDRYYEDRTDE
jgi:hypothetical protein